MLPSSIIIKAKGGIICFYIIIIIIIKVTILKIGTLGKLNRLAFTGLTTGPKSLYFLRFAIINITVLTSCTT